MFLHLYIHIQNKTPADLESSARFLFGDNLAVIMPPGSHFNSDSDLESVLSLQDEVSKKKSRRDSTGPKFVCSVDGKCGASFKRQDQLDRHEYHHTGVKKYNCLYDNCDKSYSIVSHLKRHVRLSHERKTDEPAPKVVKCSMEGCKKMFTNPCNMKRHVREAHEHPKEYECSHCNAKFTQKLKMRRHEIVKHTRAFPYTCDKCGRGFYQRWQQEKHVPTCKIYRCDDCNMQFDKWTLYLKHCREMQHGRKYYNCESCDRVYSKESDLRKHVIAKHASDDTAGTNRLSFACTEPNCNRIYAYERNLRQHMLTAHTGRRFECTFENCSRCFSSTQNLVKHLAREHHAQPDELKRSPEVVTNPTKKVKRKRRKDAGKSIVSNLTKFAGLEINKDLDKELRERVPAALETTKLTLLEKTAQEDTDFDALLQEVLN